MDVKWEPAVDNLEFKTARQKSFSSQRLQWIDPGGAARGKPRSCNGQCRNGRDGDGNGGGIEGA